MRRDEEEKKKLGRGAMEEKVMVRGLPEEGDEAGAPSVLENW
jgi:hypothetical protein